MRPKDITRRGRRPSRSPAAQRSSLPTTLPRPVKLTRDPTYTVPPSAHIRVLGVELEGHERDEIAQSLA
jgi:hypothetical protein